MNQNFRGKRKTSAGAAGVDMQPNPVDRSEGGQEELYFSSSSGAVRVRYSMPNQGSLELPGLQVTVEKVVHHQGPDFPPETPHAFVYFIAIANLSDRTVTLQGRKWILRPETGPLEVVEGDGIVGQEPVLRPGEVFRYNSYHLTDGRPLAASGAFHGRDEAGQAVHVKIPEIPMSAPLTD
jgi:ApaG protein